MNVMYNELICDQNNEKSEAAYEKLLDLLQRDGVVEIDEFKKEFSAMYQLDELVLLDDAVAKIEDEFSMILEFSDRVYLVDYVIDEDDDLTGEDYGS